MISFRVYLWAALLMVVPALSSAGPIVSVEASRVSGPAPLAVHFDATGTTHTDKSVSTWREVIYAFNYDDAGSGFWSTTGNSKNSDVGGPIGAHVFEQPGTYSVRVTATDGSNNTDTQTITITVENPDVVYSGAKTVVISTNSDTSGAPYGATLLTNQTSWPSVKDGTRYLLMADQDYTSFGTWNIDAVHNWQIGKLGSGSDPEVDRIWVQYKNSSSRNWASNGTISDIYHSGEKDLRLGGVSGKNILALRVTSDAGFTAGTAAEYYYNNSGQASGYRWPEGIFVVDSYTDGKKSRGVIFYGMTSKLVILGSTLINPSQHNIRTPVLHKGLISNTNLAGAGSSQHNIKMHSFGLDEFSSELTGTINNDSGPRSSYNIVRECYTGNSETNAWAFAVAALKASDVSGLEYVILENNEFNTDVKAELILGGREMVSRGNITSGGRYDVETSVRVSQLPSSWDGPYYLDGEITVVVPSPPVAPSNFTVTLN